MAFKDDFPEFAPIEERIRQARAERSVSVGYTIANALVAIHRWIKPDPRADPPHAMPMLKRFAPHR
jgi:hypothetical protein